MRPTSGIDPHRLAANCDRIAAEVQDAVEHLAQLWAAWAALSESTRVAIAALCGSPGAELDDLACAFAILSCEQRRAVMAVVEAFGPQT